MTTAAMTESKDSTPPCPQLTPVERLYVWGGLAGLAVIFVGMVVAHMLPPPAPSRTPEEVADFYRTNTQSIRIGTLVVSLGAVLLAPWYAVMACRMFRIPGHGPASAFCFGGTGLILMYQIVWPLLIGQTAAYRPERAPSETVILNDFFFIQFIAPTSPYLLQLVVAAVAILGDRSPTPAFPRWVAYVCLWAAAADFGPLLLIFFKSGLWAWNGIFGLWVAAIAFGIWMVVLSASVLAPPREMPAGRRIT
jgi:hypothetical protein